MKPAKFILPLVIASMLLALFPRPAYACSCAELGPPENLVAGADALFAGKVISMVAPGPVNGLISSADPVKVTFQVQAVWKGLEQPTLIVITPRDSASCGFDFVVGKTYLVYAYGEEASLETNICTRTQTLATAGEDLAVLGTGAVPTPDPIAALPAYPIWIFVAVLAIVLASAAFLNRRK